MTAKEQTRDILSSLATQNYTEVAKVTKAVDQALSQIEEIVMGVIGEKDIKGYKVDMIMRNQLRTEQLKRWSDK